VIPGITAPTSVVVCRWALRFQHSLLQLPRTSENGLIGYLKQLAGPIWWMAPLLFVIETISHLARVLSLTVRLYANMFAGDLLTLVSSH